MLTIEQAKKAGLVIDETCYPNVAYHGLRFAPEKMENVLTTREDTLLAALRECIDLLKWVGPVRGYTWEESHGTVLRTAEEAIDLTLNGR